MLKRVMKGVLHSRKLATLSTRHFSKLVNHRDSPENNEDTYFEFTDENYEKIKTILKKYPDNYKRSGTIPLLMLAQKQNGGFLTLAAMNKVAKVLEVPRVSVYEVASFYAMFNREKVGKYQIQICGTTPCLLCGAQGIIKACEEELGIRLGETTSDGMFTIEEVECLGACVNAPMIQINNEHFYEDLTPEIMKSMIREWKQGKEIKPGPQNGLRKNAEGPQGRTTLLKKKDNPFLDRDFGAALQDWEEEKKKKKAK